MRDTSQPNWVSKSLGELTDKIGSGATPKGGQSAYKESGISLIRSLNVHDLEFRYKDLARIDDEQAAALSNVEVEARDVLLNITGASIARCSQVPPDVLPARVNQHVSILRPIDGVLNSRFLSYLLVSDGTKNQLLNIGDNAGATRQALTKAQLQAFEIRVPPLEEQKRIVAVLDQAFAALDRARAHAEANLADAPALFGSSLAEAFYSDGVIPTRALGAICKFEGGSQPPKSQFADSPRKGYIRLLQIRDFKSDEKAVYILDDGKRRRCTADDIMIGRYGASVGQIHRGKSGTYNVALIKTIPSIDLLVRDYFYYYLVSDLFQKPLLSRSSRGAQDGFSKEDIAPFLVPVPTLEAQDALVSKLSSIEADTKRLVTQYEQKLTDLANLRQSLLQKAFSGELT